jgi:hypothetical protein
LAPFSEQSGDLPNNVTVVSVYGVNKVSHLLQESDAFREQMAIDPGAALAPIPLTDDERSAFLSGDVAALYLAGAHTFLLSRIPRFLPDLMSRDEYIQRLRSLLSPEERAEVAAASLRSTHR